MPSRSHGTTTAWPRPSSPSEASHITRRSTGAITSASTFSIPTATCWNWSGTGRTRDGRRPLRSARHSGIRLDQTRVHYDVQPRHVVEDSAPVDDEVGGLAGAVHEQDEVLAPRGVEGAAEV